MYETQTHHNDHGAPDQLGSGSGAPARRRARGSGDPQYVRSVFADAGVRDLVAAACEDQIAALQADQSTHTAAAGMRFVIKQLDAVVNELRAV